MILVDFSSTIHRKLHSSISSIKPSKVNDKFVTDEFINYTLYSILKDLFEIEVNYGKEFGEIVICLDDKSPEGYWRKDVYPLYKSGRSKGRLESPINYSEVWVYVNKLTDALREHSPWKVVKTHRAEADDIILVIADLFGESDKVLIHSPDKDMIQVQNDNVKQYSALTNKWVTAEQKADKMDEWILEHICLGDVADEVPKVVDSTEFSEAFIEYLKENNVECLTPWEFKDSKLTLQEKQKLLSNFDVFKLNRKGEKLNKDIYKTIGFGPAKLHKAIEKFGSLDSWLDSHPMYRQHYERNKILVLLEGIPEDIKTQILKDYNESKSKYNRKEFEKYLHEAGLSSIIMELPSSFKGELTLDDFDW